METFAAIFASVLIVSIISLAGAFTLSIDERRLKNIIFFLMSFAAGTMLASAFFDLLPEAIAIEGAELNSIFAYALLGMITFFCIERSIHLYHCHNIPSKERAAKYHPVAYLNLIGDGMHNFLDGVAIAIAYLINMPTGVAVTIAVIAHEIPQELGDFGVLIHSGLSRARALALNLLSAITAFAGAVITYLFSVNLSSQLTIILLSFSGGGFIYMAAANLIPELHKEENILKSIAQLAALFAGIAIILIVAKLE